MSFCHGGSGARVGCALALILLGGLAWTCKERLRLGGFGCVCGGSAKVAIGLDDARRSTIGVRR